MNLMDSEPFSLRLCALDELPDGAQREGREFSSRAAGHQTLFLIRVGEEVLGYRNRCPHVGSPLNWTPDRFLDEDRRHIVCATHGAVFRVQDGVCISGPCVGDALVPVALEIRDDAVYLLEELHTD
jgi:nitrite reductase/ring-hydroxylating ferredoxin subunit